MQIYKSKRGRARNQQQAARNQPQAARNQQLRAAHAPMAPIQMTAARNQKIGPLFPQTQNLVQKKVKNHNFKNLQSAIKSIGLALT